METGERQAFDEDLNVEVDSWQMKAAQTRSEGKLQAGESETSINSARYGL